VNDWCAFTGLDTTATEISVIEATFSPYPCISFAAELFLPHLYRAPGSKFERRRRRDARSAHRQLGMRAIHRRLTFRPPSSSTILFSGLLLHHQYPVICTPHLTTFASKRNSLYHRQCPVCSSEPALGTNISVKYPVNDAYPKRSPRIDAYRYPKSINARTFRCP
jgi:hypothetical protein